MTVVPDVAEAFDVSDDGTRYTFVLRDNAWWHDGTPVTACDFAWTWERMRAESVKTAFLLEPLLEARVLDESTLELELQSATNTFLYILGHPAAFPWPSHLGVTPAETPGELVGNGPFKLARATERGIQMIAVDGWPLPRGNVRTIDFVHASPEDAGLEWAAGKYDAAFEHLPRTPRPEEAETEIVAAGFSHLTFRTREPPFDDVRVRKAVACAIDRERFVASFAVLADDIPAVRGGLIPPSMPGHVHDVGIGYDPERARSLLAEVGHPGGTGIDEITVLMFEFVPETAVNELQRQLGEIGIAARVELLPFHEYDDEVRRRGNMYLHGWMPDVPDPGSVFEPHFSEYPDIYRDEALLSLLERARAETDLDERLRLYGEVDRLVVAEHAALVPVSYRRGALDRRSWVSGVWMNGYAVSCLE